MTSEIRGTTELFGLIGHPVAHSLSPQIHNFLFRRLGIDACYLAFSVPPERLKEAVQGLKALGVRGWNVTHPYKRAVIPLLDHLSPEARAIGAVNTVRREGEVFAGYNTDAEGFRRALHEEGIEVRGARAVVLGSGGAGAAVIWALLHAGALEVVLCSRNPGNAQKRFQNLQAASLRIIRLDGEHLAEELAQADLLVNATPVGSGAFLGQTPVPAPLLHRNLTVIDLIYAPSRTRLIEEAEEKGARTINGLGMLLHQAFLAFELWTGLSVPEELQETLQRGFTTLSASGNG